MDRVAGEAEVVELDLLDGEAIKRTIHELRPERIFHLAAYGAYSWQRDSSASCRRTS